MGMWRQIDSGSCLLVVHPSENSFHILPLQNSDKTIPYWVVGTIKRIHIKHLAQFLAHNKHSINSNY